ncbi:pentatricopeptide repeat-containing protein At3g26540 [Punica granatum]|uniref:Uncharacterized protein n=2 Tax=Punica granatum TaxID=22663 RepID=A0A218XJK4_PUNGR|nr:pentatricopeptide repeat-containing protein At3g26540 [Punica granatum]OWM85143.1 hypothetical protein CDL15_Pgr027930 [Punica granatum]PKI54464.1 hypothetical protein CRG98_025147 [Punica granatum]
MAGSVVNHLLPKANRFPPAASSRSPAAAVLALLEEGNLKKAVSVLFSSPVPFPPNLYARLFSLCSSNLAIVEARKLESHLVTFNPDPPTFLLNRAIEVYAECGCLKDARELFEEMPQRNGGSWNAMITAYSRAGLPKKALGMFKSMYRSGFSASEVVFAGTLRACSTLLDISLSKQIHGLIVRTGFSGNLILGSSVVDTYGKCGVMSDARRMFDEIPRPNEVSWNVIVRRYLEMGDGKEAISMFFKMFRMNTKPLNFTFSNALVACSSTLALNEGMQIHGMVIKTRLEEDEVISCSLISMYIKCRKLDSAQKILELPGAGNIVSWTTMLSGYVMIGETKRARKLFDEMPERNVISWNAMLVGYTRLLLWEEALDFFSLMRSKTKEIDHVTLGLMANIGAGLSDIELGKQVHGFVYRNGYHSNLFVGNSLLDMYGKCGDLRTARAWFHQMGRVRDQVSWNSLLTSYARHRMSEQAMDIFPEMQWETTPSKFTFGTLLAACANIFAINNGKQIHGFMLRKGYEMDLVVRGALVDMYSKCRNLEYAIKVFREAASRDVVLWNSLILGCYHNRQTKLVLDLFKSMEGGGITPDHVTLHGVLLACVSEGLVDFGRKILDSMSEVYSTIPRMEHYECMIELYSCYGRKAELEKFVKTAPFELTVPMLTRVCNSCREHGWPELGKWAAQRLAEANP